MTNYNDNNNLLPVLAGGFVSIATAALFLALCVFNKKKDQEQSSEIEVSYRDLEGGGQKRKPDELSIRLNKALIQSQPQSSLGEY